MNEHSRREVYHLAEVLKQHFSNHQASSFAHFVTVSDELTGEQAAQVPLAHFNSIWAVTNHMAFWMDLTRAAIVNEEVNLSAWGLSEVGGGWPPISYIDDMYWLNARDRALELNHALAEVVRSLDDSMLEQPLERMWGQQLYQTILMIYSHNSYHTAEILSIRHMMGLWVDHKYT
ncbi:MAG: hypothetical protein AAF702_38805 [Chloroflexota bacterium]